MKFSNFAIKSILFSPTSLLLVGILVSLSFISAEADSANSLDRSRLPIADSIYPNETEIDPNKAKMPLQSEVTAPDGAPNVVVIILDDLGFGGPSTFGGPIQMPTLDRLASNGL